MNASPGRNRKTASATAKPMRPTERPARFRIAPASPSESAAREEAGNDDNGFARNAKRPRQPDFRRVDQQRGGRIDFEKVDVRALAREPALVEHQQPDDVAPEADADLPRDRKGEDGERDEDVRAKRRSGGVFASEGCGGHGGVEVGAVRPSCPRSARASTRFRCCPAFAFGPFQSNICFRGIRSRDGVDGRDEPGHDGSAGRMPRPLTPSAAAALRLRSRRC